MVLGFLKQNAPEPERNTTHQVAGRELPLTIRTNGRATRLTLRIDPSGRGLKVTVPPGTRREQIQSFLERHEGWLKARVSQLPDVAALEPGHKVPLRGVPHMIVHGQGRGTTCVRQDGDEPQIVIYGDPRFAGRRIADYLKKCAKADIEPLVQHHSKAIGKKARSIRFKDTKSRWGSCSSDGNLNFSWRIMMAPPSVINYLVAHEVAHLVHMDHSPSFWAVTQELCPDMERAKTWLRRNGPKLQAIMF